MCTELPTSSRIGWSTVTLSSTSGVRPLSWVARTKAMVQVSKLQVQPVKVYSNSPSHHQSPQASLRPYPNHHYSKRFPAKVRRYDHHLR